MLRRSLLGSMALVAALLGACGDDEGRPPPPGTDAGPRIDSGPRTDSGPRDGGPDGALDAGDGGGTGFDAGSGPTCVLGPADVWDLAEEVGVQPRTVPVAARAVGFGVAWTASQDGANNVWFRAVPLAGDPSDAVQITDDYALSRGPALLSLGDSFLVAWYDNSSGNFDVWARPIGTDGAATGSAQQITTSTLRDDNPALVRSGSGVLAAWVEDDMVGGTRIARSRMLSAAGAPSGSPSTVSAPPLSPAEPILTPRSGGYALTWAETRAGASHVIVVPLDATGASAGDPVTVDTEGNSDGTVDAHLGESGGAVVFGVMVSGVRPEVRFRAVTPTGSVSDTLPERSLTIGADERGTDPSIDALGPGYVVAYRALPAGERTTPMIRLLVVDSIGDVVVDGDIAEAASTGGRTSVAVAPDATVLITWSDIEGTTTTLRAARVACD